MGAGSQDGQAVTGFLHELEDDARRAFHVKQGETMSEPVQPAPVAGDPAPTSDVQAQTAALIGQQAAGVAGDPSAAGIYGDVAGASQHAPAQTQEQVAQGLQAAGGQAASADVTALLERIQALETANAEAASAQAKAEEDAKPKPPILEEIVSALSGASPGIVHALSVIAGRMDAAGI